MDLPRASVTEINSKIGLCGRLPREAAMCTAVTHQGMFSAVGEFLFPRAFPARQREELEGS